MLILSSRLIVTAAGGLLALAALVVSRRHREVTLEDVGPVSGAWIAQHRGVGLDD
jgi:hypothetical protein